MVFTPAAKDRPAIIDTPADKRSVMETKLLKVADLESWQRPRFQRPVRLNTKVMSFSENLKTNGGIINGVITLGQLPNDPTLWLVDGSHRTEAAKNSGLLEFIADVHLKFYDTWAQMAEDFVRLNSSLARMRPDDILRGLEENNPLMKLLRSQCSFIGYDNVRRASTTSCVLSMSAVLRCWFGSEGETPTMGGSGNAVSASEALTEEDVQNLSAFLNTAYAAWGNDPEYYRLWGNLNLTVCMWLFRQLVLRAPAGNKRYVALKIPQFNKCLMSVSADSNYIEWLLGRNMNERDRSPCYRRLRTIFVKRVTDDGVRSPKFPAPAWYVKK